MSDECDFFSFFDFYIDSLQDFACRTRIGEWEIFESEGFFYTCEFLGTIICFRKYIEKCESFFIIRHILYEISVDIEDVHYRTIYTSYDDEKQDELSYSNISYSCLICSYCEYEYFYDKLESFGCWFCHCPSIIHEKLFIDSFIIDSLDDREFMVFSCKEFNNTYIYESITDTMKSIIPEIVCITLLPWESGSSLSEPPYTDRKREKTYNRHIYVGIKTKSNHAYKNH